MINEIMDAIAIKLHEVYGDEYEIHQNDIKQGLQEPCFLSDFYRLIYYSSLAVEKINVIAFLTRL